MPKSPFFGDFSQLVVGLATAVVHGMWSMDCLCHSKLFRSNGFVLGEIH